MVSFSLPLYQPNGTGGSVVQPKTKKAIGASILALCILNIALDGPTDGSGRRGLLSNSYLSGSSTLLPWAEQQFVGVEERPNPEKETGLFWHIPKSGGTTVKRLYQCMGQTLAHRVGVNPKFGHDQDTELAVFEPHADNDWKVANVDTTVKDGILRARELGLVESHTTDLIFTMEPSFAGQHLYDEENKGRFIALFRNPVDRAYSMFYYLQTATWEKTYHPEWATMSPLEWANLPNGENNYMVRKLVGTEVGGSVTETDLIMAKELVRQRFIVGLMDEMNESIRRFNIVLGVDEHTERTETCLKEFDVFGEQHGSEGVSPAEEHALTEGGYRQLSEVRNSNAHPKFEEGSPEYEAVSQRNNLDMILYKYIENLFQAQQEIIDSYANDAKPEEESRIAKETVGVEAHSSIYVDEEYGHKETEPQKEEASPAKEQSFYGYHKETEPREEAAYPAKAQSSYGYHEETEPREEAAYPAKEQSSYGYHEEKSHEETESQEEAAYPAKAQSSYGYLEEKSHEETEPKEEAAYPAKAQSSYGYLEEKSHEETEPQEEAESPAEENTKSILSSIGNKISELASAPKKVVKEYISFDDLVQEQKDKKHNFLDKHLANVDDPLKSADEETLFFWHIPKSGRSAVQNLYWCMGATIANEVGMFPLFEHHEEEQLVSFAPWTDEGIPGKVINVDLHSQAGIRDAANRGFLAPAADVPSTDPQPTFISTQEFKFAAEHLFSVNHKARMFTMFRHPVDLAASRFYDLKKSSWTPDFSAPWAKMTLSQYAEWSANDGIGNNNLMIRILVDKEGGAPLTDEDLEYAKELISKKFVVGLLAQFEESVHRFNLLMGLNENDELNKECIADIVDKDDAPPLVVREEDVGRGNKWNSHRHPDIDRESATYELLANIHSYDVKLYEHIYTVFEEQKTLFGI